MGKLMLLTAVFLYTAGCVATMPSQCFTAKYALKCQGIQISALIDHGRPVNWDFVHSIRVI